MPQPPDTDAPGAPVDMLTLPVHGTTATAEELRIRLVLACDRGGDIEIDASEVESVGQAVLQLLVAARAEAETRNGQRFAITHPSPAFVERVAACRLTALVGLPDEEDSAP